MSVYSVLITVLKNSTVWKEAQQSAAPLSGERQSEAWHWHSPLPSNFLLRILQEFPLPWRKSFRRMRKISPDGALVYSPGLHEATLGISHPPTQRRQDAGAMLQEAKQFNSSIFSLHSFVWRSRRGSSVTRDSSAASWAKSSTRPQY